MNGKTPCSAADESAIVQFVFGFCGRCVEAPKRFVYDAYIRGRGICGFHDEVITRSKFVCVPIVKDNAAMQNAISFGKEVWERLLGEDKEPCYGRNKAPQRQIVHRFSLVLRSARKL